MGMTEQTENEMNETAAKEHSAGTGQKIIGHTAETANDSMRQAYAFAADTKLKECMYCRVMIPQKARICPNCKMTLRRWSFWKAAAAVLAAMLVGGAGYCFMAYQGLLPDSAVPVWIARHKPMEAVEAVEVAGNAAGAKPVEAIDVTLMMDSVQPETADEQQGATGQSVRTEAAEVPQGMADQAARPEMEGASQEPTEQNARPEAAEQPEAGVGLTAAERLTKAVKDTENAMARVGEIDGSGMAKQDGNGKPAVGSATLKDDGTAPADKAEVDDGEEQDDKAAMTDEESGVQAVDGETPEGKSEAAGDNAVDDAAERGRDKTTEKAGKAVGNDEETLDEEMDENEAAFRADCVRRGYKELLRNEDYLGTAVWLEAEVVCQIAGGLFDENIYYLCVEEENNINRYYIIRDDRAADETLILEGDWITVYGRLFGNCRLPANLVETRPTVPAVSMLCCDLAEE